MDHLIMKLFLRLITYCVIILLPLSLYFFYIYIHPHKFISSLTPKYIGLEYRDVTLKTDDGLSLAAWFIPQRHGNEPAPLPEAKGKVIIVCHGYPADKGDVLGIVEFLSPHYNLLLFDFRALGKSQGAVTTGGWKERKDLLAAVRFLKETGFTDIGAFGFSMGAAVILMSESRDIKAIVSDSSYASLNSMLHLIFSNFGFIRYPFVWMMKLWAKLFLKMDVDEVSPAKFIAQMKIPVFLIHSERDSQIPLEHAQLLHLAKPEAEFWIIPGADHGEGFALYTQEYQEKVLSFLKDNL